MMTRTKKRIVWIVFIAFGLVILVGVFGPLISYKRVANSVCPVSGSTRQEITWFGTFTHEERTVSALERWLKRRESSFQPQWLHISTQTYYVLGRACGTAGTPEICQLGPILDGVVERFSDERIARLVAVLREGSGDERRRAIQRISDDYFDAK